MLRTLFFGVTGYRNFTKDGYIKASKSFDDSVMSRSLAGKHVVVTGANQGLGYQTSLELAKRGATLHMVCRNAERGRQAADAIVKETGNTDVHVKVCDVSSLKDIKGLAEELKQAGQPLFALVNNAGVMVHERQQSADGYELNFATNTLGSFALTLALEPLLKLSPPSKVIFVSSGGQYTSPLEVEDLEGAKMTKHDGTVQYARDKRRQVALAERFAERWRGSGVECYSMHPGWTATEGVKVSLPGFYSSLKDKLRTLEQGADTTVYLCLQDADKLEAGGFYLDRRPRGKHLPLAGTGYSAAQVDKLWGKLEDMAAPAL